MKKEIKTKMKIVSLDKLLDRDLGPIGTPIRDQFEFDVELDVVGDTIKRLRKKNMMTQSELGALVGVKKSHISKLESKNKNVTLETIRKVFAALNAKVSLKVEV